jgi:hypothetical protein
MLLKKNTLRSMHRKWQEVAIVLFIKQLNNFLILQRRCNKLQNSKEQ